MTMNTVTKPLSVEYHYVGFKRIDVVVIVVRTLQHSSLTQLIGNQLGAQAGKPLQAQG